MQIIYAAPFLLLAAICFFVCAAMPSTRKNALVIPVGILSFGLGSLICYGIFALIAYLLGHKGPANWWYLAPYIGGGLLVAICCSVVWRNVVASLPASLVKIGLVCATFSSLLVFVPFCSFGIARFVTLDRNNLSWMIIPGIIWFSVAALISIQLVKIFDQFRPKVWWPLFSRNSQATGIHQA